MRATLPASLFLVLVLISAVAVACGGEQQTITVTVSEGEGQPPNTEPGTEQEDGLGEAPDASATVAPPPATEPEEEPQADRVVRKLGGTGIDDDVAFSVTSLKKVASVPTGEYADPPGPIRPVRGADLWRAEVTFKNNTKSAIDGFCGGGGAVLVDAHDRNFQPHDRISDVARNDTCPSLQPGFKTHTTLIFQVPKGTKINSVAVWHDDSSEDPFGEMSYVVFTR